MPMRKKLRGVGNVEDVDISRYMTLQQAANELGVSEDTLYRAKHNGTSEAFSREDSWIKSPAIGTRINVWWIERQSIEQFKEELSMRQSRGQKTEHSPRKWIAWLTAEQAAEINRILTSEGKQPLMLETDYHRSIRADKKQSNNGKEE